MRRLRKSGAIDPATDQVVVIPRLPSVTGANRPPGWNRWPADEKVQHLLGLSLDRMREYLSWPADGLDPYRLAAQTQVIRVVAMPTASIRTGWRCKRKSSRLRRWSRRRSGRGGLITRRRSVSAGDGRELPPATRHRRSCRGKMRPAAGWPRKIALYGTTVRDGSHNYGVVFRIGRP
jgi:hypothetical protein